MTAGVIIGNCISLIAAFFTAKSSWSKDIWHIYIYQVVQCLLLAVASIFFRSYAGIVTLLVCAFRNYMAAAGKLTGKITAVCLLLILILGILLNNRGYIGWIIIAANVLYTLGVHVTKRELAIKCNIVINLVLWMIYEILILDIPSFAADGIGLAVTVASIIRLLRFGSGSSGADGKA